MQHIRLFRHPTPVVFGLSLQAFLQRSEGAWQRVEHFGATCAMHKM